MTMISPAVYRKLIHPLVNNKITYLAGMVLVRYCRKLRVKKNRNNDLSEDLVEVKNYAGNIKIIVDKHSYMGGSIFWTGYHHLNECLYLKQFLKPEMTFIDAGANQGEFTLFAAKRLFKGNVIAFEPVNTNLISLKRNIALNSFSNVLVVEKGLYDKDIDLPIYTSSDSELNGGRHEGLSTVFPDDYRNEFEQTIKLINFDEHFADNLTRFDFFKIDIEGSELFALKGMEKSLRKFRPQILIELNKETAENGGYKVQDILSFLHDLGYQSYVIFRGKLVPKVFSADMNYANFVFIHEEMK